MRVERAFVTAPYWLQREKILNMGHRWGDDGYWKRGVDGGAGTDAFFLR